MKLILAFLLSISVYAQTAVYPGRVATDADLGVAANRISTTLTNSLTTNGTTFTVSSSTRIVSNSILTLGTVPEFVWVCNVSGSTITVGKSSCPNVDGRGVDGSTAVVHTSGEVVVANVNAWFQRAAAEEIKAIEKNAGSAIYLVSADYDFAAQAPGGSLIAGNNAITMTPVPKGVNGTNTNHRLYVSGGVGTAESCLITGGTGTSGQTSGQIIINCANTHSGAWTIGSIGGGIPEAIHALPGGGGTIAVPAGTVTTRAPIVIDRSTVRLVGQGNSMTSIQAAHHSGPVLYLNGGAGAGSNEVRDITVSGDNNDSGFAVLESYNQSFTRIENVVIGNGSIGLLVDGPNSFFNRFAYLNIPAFIHDAVRINTLGGGSGNFDSFTIGGNGTGGNGFNVISCVGAVITNSYVQSCVNGLIISPGVSYPAAFVDVVQTLFDGNTAQGVVLNANAGTTIQGIRFVQCSTGNGQVAANGVLVQGAGTISGVTFDEHISILNAGAGFGINAGSDISLNNCISAGNSALAPGSSPGLSIAAPANRVKISGGTYAASWNFGNTQNYGIALNTGADQVTVENATVTPNLTAGFLNGTLTNSTLRNNPGYNPVGSASITPGASPYTYTAGMSPEVVYIYGGTVSNVSRGGTQLASATGTSVYLPPNGALTVTYSVAPTMKKDVQ